MIQSMSFIKVLSVTSFISLNVFANYGGVSGGGGDVINPKHPTSKQSTESVEHIIKNSKFVLEKYLQSKKIQLKNNQLSGHENNLYSQLFNSPEKNIDQVMKSYKIHIEDEEPCFTSDNVAVDGSIFSEKTNSVCISSLTIAQKVDHSEVLKQSAALVLHELSEVSGLTDDDAIHLQKIALDEIK